MFHISFVYLLYVTYMLDFLKIYACDAPAGAKLGEEK